MQTFLIYLTKENWTFISKSKEYKINQKDILILLEIQII
jgi:hypothetical protein